jgi:hypothetical protein
MTLPGHLGARADGHHGHRDRELCDEHRLWRQAASDWPPTPHSPADLAGAAVRRWREGA